MNDSRTTGRPWLAVVLSVAVTGLGHLYLRKWRRAAMWLLVVVGTSLLVPEAALEALADGGRVDVVALAPVLVVSALCTLDAYVLARRPPEQARSTRTDEDTARCPHCGGELTAGLDFCHWCTTELDEARPVERGESQ